MGEHADSIVLLACVCGVWLTWSTHDYLQERVFRAPGWKFGVFMAFALQSVSFLLSLGVRVIEALIERSSEDARRRQQQEETLRRQESKLNEEQEMGLLNSPTSKSGGGDVDEAPDDDERTDAQASPPAASWTVLLLYLALSLLIAAANGCATAALNFVSMQSKVLFKSSKIVTTMLLGSLFGRIYTPAEYAYMLMVMFGLAAFLLAGGSTGSLSASAAGIALLSLAVLADSLVPNLQQKLLQGNGRPKQEMVFHTNWCSAVLTAGYAVATGEFSAALAYLGRKPRITGLLLLQSIAGCKPSAFELENLSLSQSALPSLAFQTDVPTSNRGVADLGILAYLETVKRFGSKVTVVVTSCRKLFTIALSSLAFGHPLTGFHLAGVLAVFLGVVLNANHDRACSRLVAVPAVLLLMALLVVELRLLESSPGVVPFLEPVRAVLSTRFV